MKRGAVLGTLVAIINGHIPVSSISEQKEYADFTREFVAIARASLKAGKTQDQAAAEYTVPARFKGYSASINPAFVNAKGNLQIAYDELQKK